MNPIFELFLIGVLILVKVNQKEFLHIIKHKKSPQTEDF